MNFVDTADQLVNIAQLIRRCPTVTLMRAFTKSYRDWAGQTQYLRLTIAGATVAEQVQYELGSDPYTEIVGIFAMSGTVTPTPTGQTPQTFAIVPSDSSTWNPGIGPGQPRRFQYIPEAQFALNPTPSLVYALTVTAIVQPKEGAISIPDTGLIKWRTGIEAGALAYLQSLPGQTWTNPVAARENQKVFQSSVNNARAAVQRSFNVGTVIARPRVFGGG